MAIRHWHWGKLVIVWAWTGVVCATFLVFSPSKAPVLSTVLFLASVAVLIGATATTWVWLGGKERDN